MKTYNIPSSYEVWGIAKVEANSLQEAVDKAMKSLPINAEYIEDSHYLDFEGLESFNIGLSETEIKNLNF